MTDHAESQASDAEDPKQTERLARDLGGDLTAHTSPDTAASTRSIDASHIEIILGWQDTSPPRERVFNRHGEFLIGRTGAADLRLDDLRVSGRHALIIITPERCEVRDLDSTHGTRLNGERIRASELKSGDILECGRTRFTVQIKRHEVPPTRQRCHGCGREFTAADAATGDLCSFCKAAEADRDPEVKGYELVRRLGEGGQGRVYLAKELAHDNRLVALKTLRIPWGATSDERDIKTRWFHRESQNSKALRHPNIVECFEDGRAGDYLYIAMEYLAGGDLLGLVEKSGPPGWAVASRYMLDALAGMAEAHARKIVHRDLKPQNLLLNETGSVKVADLGLAKDFERAGISGMTPSGGFSGSRSFMAPEQVKDFKYVGPSADVFSLGATFFYLLTKQEAREPRDARVAVVVWTVEASIRPIRSVAPEVPSAIAEVVDRAVQRDASARYEDAGQMRAALVAALDVARA